MVVLSSEALVFSSTLSAGFLHALIYRFSAMVKELISNPERFHALELLLWMRCRFRSRSDVSGG